MGELILWSKEALMVFLTAFASSVISSSITPVLEVHLFISNPLIISNSFMEDRWCGGCGEHQVHTDLTCQRCSSHVQNSAPVWIPVQFAISRKDWILCFSRRLWSFHPLTTFQTLQVRGSHCPRCMSQISCLDTYVEWCVHGMNY